MTYINRFPNVRIVLLAACVGIFLPVGTNAGAHEDADAVEFGRASRAAAQGSVEDMYRLGNLYLFAAGIPKSEADPDQRAAQFFFEAARRGHAGAQHALGILYATGKGVQQDAAEADKWFGRAAAQGHSASRPLLQAPAR